MMFNKILLTSVAVAGLALTAVHQQFHNSKSTTDQAAKVSNSVNGKTVKTAVSSLDNIKSLETTAASQDVATDQKATTQDTASDTASQSSDSSAATVQTTAVSTQPSTVTSTAASSSSAASSTTAAATATASTSSDASGDINWLIQRESGGNVNAQNGSFYGIGQLSASAYATYAGGQDYHGNYAVQLQAMQGYIAGRYGSVANAISHFQSNGWY
ncbi:peptidoglycan-binding protein [Fructobacillus fructosus]|uniref:aggregation-promoting factor C-terminal-like domain-containing protein n=1 Tax=Fructobacillus fructosus TaxID=1631 RepID=UPI002D8D1D11|nr:LysM repeat (LysM) [Fructobacillus fructosus]CAK1238583.1 LysM repeat (LysM) [Fructobacillus fructosus]CAK1239835.1 LysM repeat (LysM) [Fructobacillus fructosus]